MKKGLVITLIIFIILVCLSIPTKYELKDGGTVVYKAVTWNYSKLNSLLPDNKVKTGDTLYICGIKVKDTTKVVEMNETKKETKTETKTEEKETRYYQYQSESEEKGPDGNPLPKYYEVELNKDGTAKIAFLRVSDTDDKVGIYTENDKYVIIAVNNLREQCKEPLPQIADVCSESILFIKDNGVLKHQVNTTDHLYHFEIDNVNNVYEYKQVQKSDLQTSLKN